MRRDEPTIDAGNGGGLYGGMAGEGCTVDQARAARAGFASVMFDAAATGVATRAGLREATLAARAKIVPVMERRGGKFRRCNACCASRR